MALIALQHVRDTDYAAGRAFGAVGPYRQVDALATFAVDPLHPANAGIVDLALAPRDAAGLVSFQADFSVLVPAEPERGSACALVELPNRGRRRLVPVLNRAPADAPVSREAHPGDGFLFERGYTVASIGWQWDVCPDEALLGLRAPVAMRDGQPVTGQTMVEIRPSQPAVDWLLADRVHRPLPAASGAEADAVLLVRDWEDGPDTVVDGDRWCFGRAAGDGAVVADREYVHLRGGFEPGRIYQLVYTTDHAPVAGAGLLALRDVAPFLRTPAAHNPAAGGFDAVIAWGVSQTGRMLRHFLSLGLNRTEDGAIAFDGVHPHVAGARRGAFNHRFAQPSNQTTPLWGHVFPFADGPGTDSLTGRAAGLLDRLSASDAVPKIIATNSAAEYWRGDAALAHIATDAGRDLDEHPSSRSYLFASTQHGAGYPGQSRTNSGVGTTARHPLNVLDYRPLLRASLVNLERWITHGVEPPASRYPKLADGTAVSRAEVLARLAGIAGLAVPDPDRLPVVRTVDMGADEDVGVGRYPAREGEVYPALVSGVDADGNELAGIRLPDVSVPVGTHAGWNPRDPATGAAEQIVPMNGLTLWFPATRAARATSGERRAALAERYAGRDAYAQAVRAAAEQLVEAHYLLAGDVEVVTDAALARYDAAVAAGAELAATGE